MAGSPVLSASTVVLQKRKRTTEPLVLHLASPPPGCDVLSASESEYEPSSAVIRIDSDSGEVASWKGENHDPKRRYKCTFDGCTKAYSKPSRLAEHERSHTGDRPFVCTTCDKSFLRECHLQVHARAHLPGSERPFACEEPGCGKRFWTAPHLLAHSKVHTGEKPFKCAETCCDAAFSKHHQLREHICSAHRPPGTKPYRCEHAGCTKSFPNNQKLRAHMKTHDNKRYTCVHESCLPAEGALPTYYPTWSSLQQHMRSAHRPTCPYPSCNGKTFSAQAGLRAHLKIHAQRDAEADLDKMGNGSADECEDEKPRKRRRGGELGRDWICEIPGCGKDFKSKHALTTHTNVSHLGRRDFVCSHSDCGRAFGWKHLLQRHVAKVHSNDPLNSDSEEDHEASDEAEASGIQAQEQPRPEESLAIDFITGQAYATHSREQMNCLKVLKCPHPHLPAIFVVDDTLAPSGSGSRQPESSSHTGLCQYVFSRAYDFRRHIRVEHGIEVEKEIVDEWVKEQKEAKATSVRSPN
ncbi:hypothetical protein BKA93DRAFT_737472 [Sparassis latifolia]